MLPIAALKKNCEYQEWAKESDAIFGDMVRQMTKLKIFQRKTDFAPSFNMQYPILRLYLLKLKLYFDKLDVVMF